MNGSSMASTSSGSSVSYTISPFSRYNATDRDLVAQRALLGENAYVDELESPSRIATPSPMIKQLSPLTVATHLDDPNPFLSVHDLEDACEVQPAVRRPKTLPARAATPLKHNTAMRQAPHHRSSPSSSLQMTAPSGTATEGDTTDPLRHSRAASQAPSVESRPTIQEKRITPPVPPRRRTAQPSMNTYALPPSSLSPSSSSSSSSASASASPPTWRRPSRFPLGPVPPPLPPRRTRQEPQPHIVDIAVERFKINTHTLSYNPSPASSASSHISPQQNERQRQWEKWENERIRAQQMTNEAAKNNRVQAPRSNTSSSMSTSIVTPTTPIPSPAKPRAAPAKKPKRSWWCFGGGPVESDLEEEDEKADAHERRRRSVSSFDDIEVEEDEEDEEDEWNNVQTSSGNSTGLLSILGLSCSKSGSNRKGATLKKKVQ